MSVGNITSYPPVWPSAKFNSYLFQGTKYITRQEADLLYASTYSIRNIAYINDVTEGIASAQKALILDSSKNITGINSITIVNNTASTSSITGAIQCAGGAYFGNHCLYNGNITLQGLSAILNLSGASSIISLSNTSQSTSSTSGAIQCAGGAYFGDNCLFAKRIRTTVNGEGFSHNDGTMELRSYLDTVNFPGDAYFGLITNHNLNITTNNVSRILISGAGIVTVVGQLKSNGSCFLGITSKNICIGSSTDTTRMISALNSSLSPGNTLYMTLGVENSNGNQGEIAFSYAGYSSTSNALNLGFHSNNTLINIVNTSTVSATGKVNLCNPGVTTGNLNVKNNILIANSATAYTTLASTSAGALWINQRGSTNYDYGIENGSLGMGTNQPRFRIDLGSQGALSGTNDYIMCLYAASNNLPNNGIGVKAGDNMFFSTAGTNGFIWRTTTGLINVYHIGTRIGQLWQTGHLEATSGVRAGEYAVPPYTGKGVEMHWSTSSNLGDVFAYDRTGGTFLPLRFNNIIYTTPSNSRVGINKASPASTLDVVGNVLITASGSTPLVVSGTGTWTRSGTFGWLQSAGAGSATGFTNRSFSIYSSGGILVDSGEIDSFSDIRMKKNIQEITDDKALLFLKINPIKFLYNNQDDNSISHIGYRAQDFVKYNFNDIVGFTNIREETKLERQTITTIDGNEIILEEDIKLTINQLSVIPYLHKLVQIQNKLIIDNQKLIESLQNQLKEMRSDDETLYDMIEDIHKFLNISTE